MKTIVHIGMPKTGSTALQGSLHKSAAYLAQRGVLYPTNPPGRWSTNHQLLQALIVPFEGLTRGMKKRGALTKDNIGDKVDEFFRHVRDQIETQRPDCVVMSIENLFRRLPADEHETLRKRFQELGGETRFMAYLRQPSQYYLSSLQQWLKDSGIVKQPGPLAYRKALQSYVACFGRDMVSARLFHRDHLEQGNIVADFCAHYLGAFAIDMSELQPADRTNDSLSAESMDILARYQAFGAEGAGGSAKDAGRLIAALADADRRLGAARPRLRPGIAEIIDYASHDCLWVRDRFGVVFPDLDYERLAAAAPSAPADPERTFALEELIVVDRELQAQILDDLVRSPWAVDAARKTWAGRLAGAAVEARPEG